MRRRSTRIYIGSGVIIFAILLIISITFFVFYSGHFQKQGGNAAPVVLSVATVYPMNNVPTPSLSQTRYSNTKYGYSFMYPSQWKLHLYTFQGVDTVQVRYQVEDGDGYPLDVSCAKNTEGLNAQDWSKQNGSGTGIGNITLKSGETAYLTVGYGQEEYKKYIFVHNNVACTLSEYIANQQITIITDSIVNSFTWQ